MRKATVATRDAIRAAALAKFRRRGYSATTLQEIGDEVGLTRGAVLHHFNAKAELLASVVVPWLDRFDRALATAVVSEPPTTAERQRVLRRFADLVLDNRAIVELLSGDVGALDALGSADAWTARVRSLTMLLAGSHATPADLARTAAAVGAILHPAANGWLDLDAAPARLAVVDAGVAAICPRVTALGPTALLAGWG